MLRNLLGLLAPTSSLHHVALLQGTKAYGVHVRPLAVPARENRSEMHEQANFLLEPGALPARGASRQGVELVDPAAV